MAYRWCHCLQRWRLRFKAEERMPHSRIAEQIALRDRDAGLERQVAQLARLDVVCIANVEWCGATSQPLADG